MHPARRRECGKAELQHRQHAARPQHAMELAHGGAHVAHVAKSKGDRHRIDACVGLRECCRVAVRIRGCAAAAPHATAGLRSRHVQHGWRVVHARHGGARVGEGFAQVARAARHIQHAHAGQVGARKSSRNVAHGAASPRLIQSKGVQSVVQVVAGRDGAEHGAHARGLLWVRMRVLRQSRLIPGGLVGGFRGCGIGHGAILGPFGVA